MTDLREEGPNVQRPEATTSPCCSATRSSGPSELLGGPPTPTNERPSGTPNEGGSTAGMVRIPAGIFRMGTDEPTFLADGEHPLRRIRLKSFWIDRHAVSNARFARFVDATGYRTEAEAYGWSFVFHAFVASDSGATRGAPSASWWRQIFGANWQHPEGPGSGIEDRATHPAVHLSWNDAVALAGWEGKRLATEAEWEYAARGGLEGAIYPWGDELLSDGRHRCNIWQGRFPHHDTVEDGYHGTCPIDAFEANGYGLWNMTGNVWEWCADWFTAAHAKGPLDGPTGPATGPGRVIRGGSYLCHRSYCDRYRVAARTHNTPDSSTGHMGVRLAQDTATET